MDAPPKPPPPPVAASPALFNLTPRLFNAVDTSGGNDGNELVRAAGRFVGSAAETTADGSGRRAAAAAEAGAGGNGRRGAAAAAATDPSHHPALSPARVLSPRRWRADGSSSAGSPTRGPRGDAASPPAGSFHPRSLFAGAAGGGPGSPQRPSPRSLRGARITEAELSSHPQGIRHAVLFISSLRVALAAAEERAAAATERAEAAERTAALLAARRGAAATHQQAAAEDAGRRAAATQADGDATGRRAAEQVPQAAARPPHQHTDDVATGRRAALLELKELSDLGLVTEAQRNAQVARILSEIR